MSMKLHSLYEFVFGVGFSLLKNDEKWLRVPKEWKWANIWSPLLVWFCFFLYSNLLTEKNCQVEKRRIRRRTICEYRKRTSSMRKLQRYIFNCTFRSENIPHNVITIQAFLLISILGNRSFMGTIIEMYRHIVFHGFGTRFKVVVCSEQAKKAPRNVHT